MNIVAAVIVSSSMPMRYTSGLIDDPGWRQPSDRTSNWGWNFLLPFDVYDAEPHVGEHLAGPVVDDARGCVVEVVAGAGP